MIREEFANAFRDAFDAGIHSLSVEYVTLGRPTLWPTPSGNVHSMDAGIMTTISVICSIPADSPFNAYHFEVPSDVMHHSVDHVNFSRDDMLLNVLVTLRYRTMDLEQFLRDLKNIPYRRYCESFQKQLEDKLD